MNERMSRENVEGINQHLYSSDMDVQTTPESETVQTEFHRQATAVHRAARMKLMEFTLAEAKAKA